MDFYYQIEHILAGTIEVFATIKPFSQISTHEKICIAVAGRLDDSGLAYRPYLFTLPLIVCL